MECVSTYLYPESPYGGMYGYIITKFSRMDSSPNFLRYGAPRSCVREAPL